MRDRPELFRFPGLSGTDKFQPTAVVITANCYSECRKLNFNCSSCLSGLAIFERGRVELPFFHYRYRFSREPMAGVLDNTDILGVRIPFF